MMGPKKTKINCLRIKMNVDSSKLIGKITYIHVQHYAKVQAF